MFRPCILAIRRLYYKLIQPDDGQYTAVFFSVFIKYRTDYFPCGSPLKLVTSSDSGKK